MCYLWCTIFRELKFEETCPYPHWGKHTFVKCVVHSSHKVIVWKHFSRFTQATNHSNMKHEMHNSYKNSNLKIHVHIHAYPRNMIPVVNNYPKKIFWSIMSISTLFRNAPNIVPVMKNPHSDAILRHMSASYYFCAGQGLAHGLQFAQPLRLVFWAEGALDLWHHSNHRCTPFATYLRNRWVSMFIIWHRHHRQL